MDEKLRKAEAEFTHRNAADIAFEVYVQRVMAIVNMQANGDNRALVMIPPKEKEVAAIERALIKAAAYERALILELLEDEFPDAKDIHERIVKKRGGEETELAVAVDGPDKGRVDAADGA